MTSTNTKRRGFPNYFKKIGLTLIAISFIFLASLKISALEIPIKVETLKTVFIDGIIIGLSLIALSSDKIEDERTTLIKLKVCAYTSFSIVFFVIFQDLINYISLSFLGKPFDLFSGGKMVILLMLIYYIIFYELAKRGMLFKGKEN